MPNPAILDEAMLLIECPWCGAREQTEFSYHGEAHIARPADPDALSDEEWAAYLFVRKNPKGAHYERWMHAFGCRRFFQMARDTVSGEIYGIYPFGADKPAAARKAEEAAAVARLKTMQSGGGNGGGDSDS